jgi:hypothetical protein
MPGTRRVPIHRSALGAHVTPAVVELFARLEATPRHKRGGRAFEHEECELARRLALDPPWLTGCQCPRSLPGALLASARCGASDLASCSPAA